MEMTIEAAPMAAEAQMVEAVITVIITIVQKAIALVTRVASIACPSLGSHSLSAVAPDTHFNDRRLALGAFA